ncbi:MAG: ATP-binding protein [Flavipsychrobacter sp.]
MSIKKVVVIGPESTGKSTLSEALAKELDTMWVPEFAREYLEDLGRKYIEADLHRMAIGQVRAEESMIPYADRYLICDTDLHVIKVWSEAKYGNCHTWVEEQIKNRKYDLYLLTDTDLPWEDDPQREYPALEDRQKFFYIYKKLVAETGLPYTVVSGNEEERLQTALKFIKSTFN